jgi:hypothetical protein
MTNVSSLYNFRSCINGSCVNASSASRAVRNALKRYAKGTVKLEDIKIEHKVKAGPHGEEWAESESGMKLLNLNAAKITPETPKAKTAKPAEVMTLGKAMSHAAKVLSILKSREELTEDEMSIAESAVREVARMIDMHRATLAAEMAESEELAQA